MKIRVSREKTMKKTIKMRASREKNTENPRWTRGPQREKKRHILWFLDFGAMTKSKTRDGPKTYGGNIRETRDGPKMMKNGKKC